MTKEEFEAVNRLYNDISEIWSMIGFTAEKILNAGRDIDEVEAYCKKIESYCELLREMPLELPLELKVKEG